MKKPIRVEGCHDDSDISGTERGWVSRNDGLAARALNEYRDSSLRIGRRDACASIKQKAFTRAGLTWHRR